MFSPDVYKKRREALIQKMDSGIGLFLGNVESPMNYPANPYHFRQDSDFLYFFGLDMDGLAGVIDFDEGKSYLFGDDVSMDDIIWMGPQPAFKDLAARAGIAEVKPSDQLSTWVAEQRSKKRRVHFLPPYRAENKMMLGEILRENPCQMQTSASVALIRAVVSLRSVKGEEEIEEIERAVDIAYDMHTTAMQMCKEGVVEQEIFGTIEGIALAKGKGPSFPIILSINGQTLHNHAHHNTLRKGRMMVTDAGAQRNSYYSSDITRSTPVGGIFDARQKDIYSIVLTANMKAIEASRPGILNRDLHLMACRVIAGGLGDLGVMKGDPAEAVEAGAHALFMPHGLGHMMGLDVHDMEGLGEDYVGYDDKTKRSAQFGLSGLRFGRELEKGHVFTIEPGIYFIPELIDLWEKDQKFKEFIDYKKLASYRDFGGIRIEDNILITKDGYKVLGKPIPKTVQEVEETCKG